MLKLEKTSHLSNLTVRLRERDRFFEPRLLIALSFALFFHLSALFLFHVIPFSLSSTYVFPPVHVRSEVPLSGTVSVVAASDFKENDELSPPSIPIVSTMSFSLPQKSTLNPSFILDPYALQFIEERLWPKWNEQLRLNLDEPKIKLTVSGDLAEIPLISSDPLLDQMQPISSQKSLAYVTYQVQMDENTGELFWHERTESSGKIALDQVTEKILLNMRFSPISSQEPIRGILNFTVISSDEKFF